MNNSEIADQLSLLSKLMDIHQQNSFKSKTYSIAAYKIDQLDETLEELSEKELFALQGIGDSIGKVILELIKTHKIKMLDDLQEATPGGILEMMRIKGLGPKKISTIWKEMEIENIGELLYACNENRLSNYKGFGKKTQDNVIEAINIYLSQAGNYLYAQIEGLCDELLMFLQKALLNENVFLTGDCRRHAETIHTIEFVVGAEKEDIKKRIAIFEQFTAIEEHDDTLLFKYDNRINVKFWITEKNRITEKLFDTTGSPEFIALFKNELSVYADAKDEAEIFKSAGMQFIPPFLREEEHFITAAKNNNIKEVIEPGDVKAVIHSHSDWSDGAFTIEQMGKAAMTKGFEYLVISDHSKAAFYARGLSEDKIAAQHELIEKLNIKLTPFKIFKSIESDILNDGSLDYTDDVLASFDLVIASVHSNLKMGEEKSMPRLLKAIENPYTTILGHMTGRLLLSRSGFKVDYKKIIDACAANDVVIEINAHPKRLDMRWQWIQYALDKNILLSIDPDAHSIEEFNNIRYGVLAAQKGMLTKDRNLSSFSLKEFEDFLQQRRIKKGL
ncbi:helix-hairpin-helix domain-containing protein [soil metagenome]